MTRHEQALVQALVLAASRIPWAHLKPLLTRAGLKHLADLHTAIGGLVKAAETPKGKAA